MIICLPHGKNDDLSIAQSRAIAKIVYIQPPTDIYIAEKNFNYPYIINNRVAHLSLTTSFLKTRMEIFAYHQELHRNKKLLEETTFKAFVEDIKLKIALAKDSYVNLAGETFRLFYTLFCNQMVSSTSNILYSKIRQTFQANAQLFTF